MRPPTGGEKPTKTASSFQAKLKEINARKQVQQIQPLSPEHQGFEPKPSLSLAPFKPLLPAKRQLITDYFPHEKKRLCIEPNEFNSLHLLHEPSTTLAICSTQFNESSSEVFSMTNSHSRNTIFERSLLGLDPLESTFDGFNA